MKKEFSFTRRVLPPRNRGARYKEMIKDLIKNESDYELSDVIEPLNHASIQSNLFATNDGLKSQNKIENENPSACLKKESQTQNNSQLHTSFELENVSEGNKISTQVIELSKTNGDSIKFVKESTILKDLLHCNFPSNLKNQQNLVINCSENLVFTVQEDKRQEFSVGKSISYSVQSDRKRRKIYSNAKNIYDLEERKAKRIKKIGETAIVAVSSNPYEQNEKMTLFVDENGKYHECFDCKLCSKANLTSEEYPLHMIDEHKAKTYNCATCDKKCTKFSGLRAHKLTHTNEKYYCKKCDCYFPSNHISNCECEPVETCGIWLSDSVRGFTCDICELKFLTIKGLNKHRTVHKRRKYSADFTKYRCVLCEAEYSNERSLNEHFSVHHNFYVENVGNAKDGKINIITNNTRICSDMDIKGISPENLEIKILESFLKEGYAPKTSELYDLPEKRENQITKIPFKCGVCDIGFENVSVLHRHYTSSHFGKQDLSCTVCSVGVKTDAQMKSHMRLHAEEKKRCQSNDLFCMFCKSNFITKDELSQHPCHDKNSQKNFKCNFCHLSFKNRSSLVKHTMVHNGQRPFTCDVCLKSFRQSSGLVRHKLWTHNMKQSKNYGKSAEKNNQKISKNNEHNLKESIEIERLELENELSGIQWKSNEQNLTFISDEKSNEYGLKETRNSKPNLKDAAKNEGELKCSICRQIFNSKKLLFAHLDRHGKRGRGMKEKLRNAENTCTKMINAKNNDTQKTLHLSNEGNGDSNTGQGDKLIIIENDEFVNLQSGGYVNKLNSEMEENHNSDFLSGSESDEADKQNRCKYCGKKFNSALGLLRHTLTHKGSSSLKCSFCNKTFRDNATLYKHEKAHESKKQWKCAICGREFGLKLGLKRHHSVHITEALRPPGTFVSTENEYPIPDELKCEKCDLVFENKSHFVRHHLFHANICLFKCGICEKFFVHQSDIMRHKILHTIMFNCKVCGKKFHRRPLYLLHMKKHSDPRPFKCSECSKDFKTKGNYNVHLRIHSGEKPYLCTICGYRCTQRSRLLTHKKKHINSKTTNFQCKVCKKYYVNESKLTLHQKTHDNVKSFECDICKEAFVCDSLWKEHIKSHAKTERLRFKCEDCEFTFLKEEHLTEHKKFFENGGLKKKHSVKVLDAKKERFLCDKCGRVFTTKKCLYNHRVTHRKNNKNYICDICGKNFHFKLSMKTHLLIHAEVYPYDCRICLKQFRSSSNLKRHERSVHKVLALRFSCNVCGEIFASETLLKTHKESICSEVVLIQCAEENREISVGPMQSCAATEQLSTLDMKNNFEQENFTRVYEDPIKIRSFAGNDFSEMYSDKSNAVKIRSYMNENMERIRSTEKNPQKKECTRWVDRISGKSLIEENATVIQDVLEVHAVAIQSSETIQDSNKRSTVIISQASKIPNSLENTITIRSSTEEKIQEPDENNAVRIDNLNLAHDETTQELYVKVFDGINDAQNALNRESHQSIVIDPTGSYLVNNEPLLIVSDAESFTDDTQNQPVDLRSRVRSNGATVISEVSNTNFTTDKTYLERSNVTSINRNSATTKVGLVKHRVDANSMYKIDNDKEKGFKCDVCYKIFAKKPYLTKHKYRHRATLAHQCEICGKRFAQKFEVAVHRMKHTKSKPFSCDFCDRCFRSKVNLVNHRMKHTGEFPFQCSICGEGFISQLKLERHTSKHVGIVYKFSCLICSKVFGRKDNLSEHYNAAHSLELDPKSALELDQKWMNWGVTFSSDVSASDSNRANQFITFRTSGETEPDSPKNKINADRISRTGVLRDSSEELKDSTNRSLNSSNILHNHSNEGALIPSDEKGIDLKIEELEGGQYSIVSDQHHDYLIENSQDIDARIFPSILHVRVDSNNLEVKTE